MDIESDDDATAIELDAVVVGAGFAGLHLLHRLRRDGLRTKVLEAGGGVGGTWYWNRYPGARCDVQSVDYSYSFDDELQQDWVWTERYASQTEILRYLDHVADRFGLRPDIELDTRVVAAHYDAADARWNVTDARGRRWRARWCCFATGCLSDAQIPPLPGLERFAGTVLHTGRWPHEPVDLSGRRVAVIGTGSSGIQVIPRLAEEAAELYVFQRTANYAVPGRNAPLAPEALDAMKAEYSEYRRRARDAGAGVHYELPTRSALDVDEAERERTYQQAWDVGGTTAFNRTFADLRSDLRANETAAEFIRSKIREVVADPETAELLSPRDHHFAAKRLCVTGDYYEAFNRPTVHLVDIKRDGIERIDEHGVTAGGQTYQVDCIVFATGFDAFTGAIAKVDLRGRDDIALRDVWADGPAAYLGLMTAGFPNLFLITGPGSPSVLSNVVVSIEQHVEFVGDLLELASERGITQIEADLAAQDEWAAHVDEVGRASLLATAKSWYLGSNVSGKPERFMPYAGGVGTYRQICEYVAATGYPGFALTVDQSSEIR